MTGSKITDKEYEHVLTVWNKFEMKKMKDCHDFYIKCDVLFLSDVFENFRNNSLRNYGICRSHYLSSPGLSWDAMFKMKKVKLKLLPDLDMYIFLTCKGTRGGISYVSNRYREAYNKYLKSYDPKEESKHVIYLDADNLYRYAIFKFLQTSGFKWIDLKRV